MPELHETAGSYVSFSHRHLWDSVLRHLALAEQHSTDSWHLHLSAGLLAAAAFEAYLNYLGEEILPSVWEDERKYFAQEPYKGTAGKLLRIAEEVGLELPGTSEKPYVGFSELQALRDKIVHARPSRKQYRSVHRLDEMPKFPKHWLELEAPPERIKTNIEHLEQLAIFVHSAIQVSQFKNAIFGAHPFLGLLGLGTHSVVPYG
jgi:hypothetical protein